MAEIPFIMHYVGICPHCEGGPLGLWTCGSCGEVVALCDECDAVWAGDPGSEARIPSKSAELACPHCRNALLADTSHWADVVEIHRCEWLQQALTAGRLTLRSATSRMPQLNAEVRNLAQQDSPLGSEIADEELPTADDDRLPGC